MRGQRQGVQSTKVAELTKDTLTPLPHQKKNNIFIAEHEVKSIMYADQTGLFLAVSSLGNKYVMILHHVDSNSSWSETM
jgi:subtilase family serine protease